MRTIQQNKAIKWRDSKSDEEWIQLEKDYGYHGHDEGLTIDEIQYIYDQEHKTIEQ